MKIEEIIAQAIGSEDDRSWDKLSPAKQTMCRIDAQAVIYALEQAGFQIVKKYISDNEAATFAENICKYNLGTAYALHVAQAKEEMDNE